MRVTSCKHLMSFVAILCFLMVILVPLQGVGGSTRNNNDDDNEVPVSERQGASKVIDAVRAYMFSVPTGWGYWAFKVKDFLLPDYFSTPNNVDFRKGGEGESESEGAAEKVKDAVVKSFDESKETVQDSAKSAARLAVEKLKRTFSGKKSDDETEL